MRNIVMRLRSAVRETSSVYRLAAIAQLLLVIAVSLVWPLAEGLAAPSAVYSAIRAEYLRLKNNDSSGDAPVHTQAWRSLDAQMRRFLAQQPRGVESVQIRVMSAETSLRLFRRTRRGELLEAAESTLSPLLGAAAPREVDLQVSGRVWLLAGDVAVYRRAFELAQDRYVRAGRLSEKRRSAERLQGLENGTYRRFVPSHDLAAPRLIMDSGRRAARAETLVVLDPGHGGEDAGAVSNLGGEEKEITLDIARRVATRLQQRGGLRVRLTRDRDEFVPLARRTAIANQNEAAVFVSLHVNASAGHDADGLEVYYLDNTNDEASRKLAERENAVDPGADVDDVSFMLSDLIQSGKMEDSVLLSRKMELALQSRVVAGHKGLRSLGVKKAPFFVLVGAHMPCSLIEMFFIDNPLEGAKLRQESFRELLAVGIAEGIERFLRTTS